MLSIAEGTVMVKRANTDAWVPAEAGMTLDEDDTIKTAEGGRALITFFEGSTIELEPGTEVRVIELGLTPDTGSTTVKLGQSIGRSISRVKKLTDSSSVYEVQTPTGVGAVRGSTMLVDVGPNGETIIRNLGGHVSVIFQGVEYPIPEFMQIIIPSDGSSLIGPVSILSRIEITPVAASVRAGEKTTFTAQGFDTENNPVNGLTYVWACNDATAGSIDPASGEFTAGSTVGSFPDAVSASAAGVAGFASVIVTPGLPTQIRVETEADGSGNVVPSQTLQSGDSLTAYAIARDAYGNFVENAAAQWSLVNITGAVSEEDLLPGPDGKSAVFKACGVGSASIHAAQGSLNPVNSGEIMVTAGPLDHIKVSPASAAMISGATQIFTAEGYDQCGNLLSGLSFAWSCTDRAAGAMLNPATGTFVAGYVAGTYENIIRVTSGDVTAFASVVVTAPAVIPSFGGGPAPTPTPTEEPQPEAVLTSIVVMPAEAEVEVGGVVGFSAQGYDQFGNPMSGLTFTWECLDEGAGSIESGTGEFTAGYTAGSFPNVIKASADGISGFASVIITPSEIAQVRVETAPDGTGEVVPSQELGAGEPLTVYAVARDAYGNFIENISASWWVQPMDDDYWYDEYPLNAIPMIMGYDDPWFLQVSEDSKSAVFFGYGMVTITIWAGLEGLDSVPSGTITVVPGALSYIQITPSEAWPKTGDVVQFSAQGYDQFGNPISGLTFTWECLDEAAGSIDPVTGLFTAGYDPGEYVNVIQVTSGGVSAFASVYVAPGPQ